MRPSLQERCDLFIENRDVIKETFKWENGLLYPVCANLFCARGKHADAGRLRDCTELLKRHTGVFSTFRGNVKLATVSMLAAGDAPEVRMADMLDNYAALKKHFYASEYLALAALLLTESAGGRDVAAVADRARAIYDKMRREHPFLTSSEDSVLALLLALSEKDDFALIADMEDCYQRLKPTFGIGNDLQAVSQVLSLADGPTMEKSARLIALFEALRAAGLKYGRHHELSVLAALSVLPVDIQQAVADIADVNEYLTPLPGYKGILGADARTRLMHAAMLVGDEYAPDPTMDAAAMGSVLAALAAQQTAMCATVICCSTASH